MTTALGHCPHRHPRNGEKLIHIRVVELIITAAFRRHLRRSEKNITHHYRWCVIHDFLPRVRGVGKSAGVFNFVRVPRLPVFSNRVVDFNTVNSAYPVGASFNNARTIDSVLANGLDAIPGGPGIMAILAAGNLRRGLALGLASGPRAASALGLTPRACSCSRTDQRRTG